MDALTEFDGAMQRTGLRVQFARVHDRVRDLMTVAGIADVNSRCSFSVDDAVAAVTAGDQPKV